MEWAAIASFFLRFRLQKHVGKEDEILHGEAFGTHTLSIGDSGHTPPGGRREASEFAERLAPLSEGGLDHCLEPPLVAAEGDARVAREPYHAALHLGRGREDAFVYGEEVFASYHAWSSTERMP